MLNKRWMDKWEIVKKSRRFVIVWSLRYCLLLPSLWIRSLWIRIRARQHDGRRQLHRLNLFPVDVFQKRMLLDLIGSVSSQSLRWISIEQAKTKVKRLQSRKTTNNRLLSRISKWTYSSASAKACVWYSHIVLLSWELRMAFFESA